MQGTGDNNEVAQVERSKVYTATGDAILRQNFKDPLLGQLLEDKYLIEEVIGWGGMSVVYRAKHVLVDRIVAIKTVKFRADERPDIWQRFQREIVTLSRLSHPNVVRVYDCVVGKDGQPYVVMDLIQGCTLDDVLAEHGRLPIHLLCSIAMQVASAVDHAHRHNVIHRDLKPANIMLLSNERGEGDPEVKVVDFGLAKLGEDNQRLTQTGQLWGSPPYISPEQIKGGAVDHRADIYSLAVVIYEMATGRDPFNSEVVYEMLHHHLHSDPPAFADMCPADPPPRELEAVIRKALSKNPDHRHQSMGELREDLERVLAMVENRQAAQGARHAQKVDAAARASTGRLNAVTLQDDAGYKRPVSPLRQAVASNPINKHHQFVSSTNLLYAALTLFLGFAAVVGFTHNPFAGHGGGISPVVAAVGAGKIESGNQSDKLEKSPEAGNARHPAALAPAHTRSPAERAPERAGEHVSGHAAQTALHREGHNAHYAIHGLSAERRHPSAPPVAAPPPATGRHSQANPSTVTKSLPNASPLRVDQSKFQLLRDLKSPQLRQECGDTPQH